MSLLHLLHPALSLHRQQRVSHGALSHFLYFLVPFSLNTGMPSSLPSILSCSMAAGLYTSAATRRGNCPSFKSLLASFADVVVFPEPCSPTIIIIVGGFEARAILLFVPPSIAVSSSLTIFTTC